MVRTTHPDISFREGLLIERVMPNTWGTGSKVSQMYWLIGEVAGQGPFLLTYQEPAVAHWDSPVNLTDGLRKKILDGLRSQVRHASFLPPWMGRHDLTGMEGSAAEQEAIDLWDHFHRERWRDKTLDDRDEDWVALAVPFAEKDAAKAAGARWNVQSKTWEAHRTQLHPVQRWMPTS